MPGEEGFFIGVELHNRKPVLAAMAVAREGLVDVENARQILGALDEAGQPEDAFGMAGKQRVIQAPTCLSTRLPATS
jgi:hypothetical protein